MATYNLGADQAHRINYDSMNRAYYADQIKQFVAAGGDINDIDRNTFNYWFNAEDDVDDAEEAHARAWATFQECLEEAKRG